MGSMQLNNKLFEEHYKSKISDLPVYDTSDVVMAEIKNKIYFDSLIEDKIPLLSEYDSKIDFTETINRVNANKRGKLIPILVSVCAAASIVFAFLLFDSNNGNFHNSQVSVSIEYVNNSAFNDYDNSEEEGTLKFMEAQCLQQAEVCNSEKFIDLKSELSNVEYELKTLADYIEKHGASPTLIRSQIRLVNIKSEITKELINSLTI